MARTIDELFALAREELRLGISKAMSVCRFEPESDAVESRESLKAFIATHHSHLLTCSHCIRAINQSFQRISENESFDAAMKRVFPLEGEIEYGRSSKLHIHSESHLLRELTLNDGSVCEEIPIVASGLYYILNESKQVLWCRELNVTNLGDTVPSDQIQESASVLDTLDGSLVGRAVEFRDVKLNGSLVVRLIKESQSWALEIVANQTAS
jgi:hypothetical protein